MSRPVEWPSEDPSSSAATAEPARSARTRVRDQLGALLVAVLLALGIRVFLVEPFRIPSGSMLPTLLVGDHLFVNKFVYGARIPLTSLRLPALREPRRGEVVVFTVAKDGELTHPADLRKDLPREEFVKRIIGVPGDRIDIVNGVVFVNGNPMESSRNGEHFEDEFGRELEMQDVTLADRRFQVLNDPQAHSRGGTFQVEEGRYFMLGDNRDYSKDSRFWGTVARAELKGPAFLVYWSWNFSGGWLDLLQPARWWNAKLRWKRMGLPVR